MRLAMSLRGIGEGHVSSITLRSLVWYGDGRLELREPSTFAVSPEIKWLPGGGAQLICADSEDVSESILFPVLPHQSRGLEDMRLVRLVEPDGGVRYLGTYTAVGPDGIGLEILEGHDFRTFDLWPVKGEIARSKGGALFPRQVDGRYLMISRHDGESLWLAQSDDLVAWDVRRPLMAAHWPWEYAQIGNCGSPIELDEGWLLLTHGVGTVRNYSIGACLLDRSDPSRVLARLREPLLKPDDCNRGGYVPNVVYSCGGVVRMARCCCLTASPTPTPDLPSSTWPDCSPRWASTGGSRPARASSDPGTAIGRRNGAHTPEHDDPALGRTIIFALVLLAAPAWTVGACAHLRSLRIVPSLPPLWHIDAAGAVYSVTPAAVLQYA